MSMVRTDVWVRDAASIAALRSMSLCGRCVKLRPYGRDDAAEVVRLRNLPIAREFLNQQQASTLEGQLAWTDGYLRRFDDLLWLIEVATWGVIGCTRLYDWTGPEVEKGSLIIDPARALAGPFALEAELLALRFAFETLRVQRVLTRTLGNNSKMKSMNARLGFVGSHVDDSRGFRLEVTGLVASDFRPEQFDTVMDHWQRRAARQ